MKAARLVLLLLALLVSGRFVRADPLSDLNASEQLWLNAHLEHYSYLIHVGGPFGGDNYRITVVAGRCTSKFQSGSGMYAHAPPKAACESRTVPELFAELRRVISTEPTALMELSFDAKYGYPQHMFIDPELNDQSETTDITRFEVNN
ncbi:MAG TPA: DUF6174 domain-containing protein [Steroidobacteraceae bacterium]|jgi:hypothetical protein